MLQYRWTFSGDPEEMICTIGVENVDAADADAVASAADLAMDGAFSAGDLGIGWTYVGVTARLGQDGGDGPIGEALSGTIGAGFTSTLPTNTAILVRKNTGLGGRRNRGRMFLPPAFAGEGDVSGLGLLSTVRRDAIQAAMNDLYDNLSGLAAPHLPPVLFHSEIPTTPTPITSFSVQTLVATQRTRMRR